MLVPSNESHKPSRRGTEERMETPGAETSGFNRSEYGVGPAEENEAITSLLLAAAAVIAFGADPGEEIVP